MAVTINWGHVYKIWWSSGVYFWINNNSNLFINLFTLKIGQKQASKKRLIT